MRTSSLLHLLTSLIVISQLIACSPSGKRNPADNAPNAPFAAYWYAGQAEISRYRLEQSRYGAMHPGEAVLIFVTEDFLTDAQVKKETDTKEEATSVLKLNASRKFTTGIYDYSMLTSVFTPIQTNEFPHSLKVTTTVQEWCGQTFYQLNFRKNEYRITSRSYFQQEGDEDYAVKTTTLEDEIWTRIRLNPQALPLGDIRLIPGTATARLRHQRLEPQAVKADLRAYTDSLFKAKETSDSLMAYTLTYPDRTLRIVFENKFPYGIAGWEETYQERSKTLTTRAIRTHTIKTDYWSKNAPQDSTLRKEAGVRMGFEKEPTDEEVP